MKKKLTTLLFGLLLAVGWTGSAQAQALVKTRTAVDAGSSSMGQMVSLEQIGHAAVHQGMYREANRGQQQQLRAPRRSQNFSAASPVTHPKAWYQALDPVTWNGGSQNITEPFTDVDGMMALVKRVYTDKTIPGVKYTDALQRDIPYQTIQQGWNILGTIYEDVMIEAHPYVAIYQIEFIDANGTTLRTWNAANDGPNFPSSWTTTAGVSYDYYDTPYLNPTSDNYMGTLTIPKSYIESLNNASGYVRIRVGAYNRYSSSSVSNAPLYIGTESFGYTSYNPSYSTTSYYTHDHILPGTITPPDDPGYTVMLVKLQDQFNNNVPQYTYSTEALRNFFTEYIKEIQLLTDGLRVNENTADAGTVFAYTGDLNKFYFIGKGKMFYLRSLNIDSLDRAPFHSMYEEFSPYVAGGTEDHSDFYEKLKQQEVYPVVHDCEGVIYMHHFFAMSGDQGTTENRVNSLVLYIPDNRGDSELGQTYDPEHQPTVGMYTIDLYADVEPSATQTDYYTVTVDWFDNLDKITHSDGIPQTYKLYEIRYNEETGKNDTTLVYEGPNNQWVMDYPVGDPSYYDLHYYVIGTPTDATNKDTFFAKSNTDDVTIPGKSDFVGLQWWRYESDYVTDDGTNQEVNYYRNFLAPHALSVQGEAGINAGNVGTAGRTLTLYREQTPIINLELMMNGNKAYYRIKYINREENQQVEPGYDPNTGERNSTNN